MKYTVITALLISLSLSNQAIFAQPYPPLDANWERDSKITSQFQTKWMYFRMLKNPLIPDHEKYVNNSNANPYQMFMPEKMRYTGGVSGYYHPDIKISKWGEAVGHFPDKFGRNQYVSFSDNCCGFYLIEKGDGFWGINKNLLTDEVLDSVHLNVYDSIFPFDNRFLVKNIYFHGKGFGEDFSFHSGNVEWGEWKETTFLKSVDYCGYIRGVQFGIENVWLFQQEFSDKIRTFRPTFPNYVYTRNQYRPSFLTSNFLIIGAPEGKEDQLIEYIYYSNVPKKTGDTVKNHYYEMRYILPTIIKSVEERRLEKRRLTDEEKAYIFDRRNEMLRFVEERDFLLLLEEEEVIEYE